MSRNPETCPHNITDVDDGEIFCEECGLVLGTVDSYNDMIEADEIDRYQQDE